MSKLVFVFLFLVPSLSYAYSCRALFNIYHNSSEIPQSLKQDLEAILLNDVAVAKIDKVRREYAEAIPELKQAGGVQVLGIVRKLQDLPVIHARNESERIVIDMGIDNLLQDLISIPPNHLSTQRLLTENIAVMAALSSREGAKSQPPLQNNINHNVVKITDLRMRLNSIAIHARRNAFDLIDGYRADFIPNTLKRERVDELLFVDQRYQLASQEKQDFLLNQIMESLEKRDGESVENIVERFFAPLKKEVSQL